MARRPLRAPDLAALYLRRRNKLIVAAGDDTTPLEYVATLLKNFEALGYGCSPALIERLQTLSERALTEFYVASLALLRKQVGADVAWEPMYPNFPQQVMDASEAELYFNAMFHYLGDIFGLRIMPAYDKDERAALSEPVALRIIELGDEQELKQIARDLIGASTSISATDKNDVGRLVGYFRADVSAFLPTEIPHKENLSFVTALLLYHKIASDILLTGYFKTTTDVLRLATALSKGDVSLAADTKFRSFTRAERRLLLSLVERCARREEDMLRHAGRWIRLGERLHPGEYRANYPKTAKAFDTLRKGLAVKTFQSRVEAALAAKDVPAALALLSARPGELARRLDHLLRLDAQTSPAVLDGFADKAGEVSTPVLLQVLGHFEHREGLGPVRTIFPKGNAAKVIGIPNTLAEIEPAVIARLVAICRDSLKARFGRLDPLGKVYVDAGLAKHVIPFSQRSASKALRTLVRGSRLALGAGSTVRFFVWWKEGLVDGRPTGRVDLDLSAVLFDAQFGYLQHVSYTNLRGSGYAAVHSGDITSAPEGACEFIDLDIASVKRFGARYIVGMAYSFCAQPFCDLPQCFIGWMMRNQPRSGEVFEPSTVVDRIDMAADTQICMPMILDLQTRELIWTDIAMRAHPNYNVNVEGNRSSASHIVRAMVSMAKPNLHTLFSLHAEARGVLVDALEEADTVFALDQGTTPFDIETIMARYMA
ncbi:MAG: TerD family protein [Bradymonadaceae bacterium]|nr:TerD family protein [Lujinxingiaceae bacterium]